MTHIDESRLLQFALGTQPGAPDEDALKSHLKTCTMCRAALANIGQELALLGSMRFAAKSPPPRLIHRQRSRWVALSRAAALVLIGVFGGMGIAALSQSERVCVLPAYDRGAAPPVSEAGYAMSEATTVTLTAPLPAIGDR